MLSKSDSKFIKSLQLKKYRKESGRFVVEGNKNLIELLQSKLRIETIYITESFFNEHREALTTYNDNIVFASEKELIGCGSFQSNTEGLAIVQIPQPKEIDHDTQNYFIVLDDVRDPGNLGTIIRIADWYNLPQIICSETCTDCYSPKVINASMGSFCRTSCRYTDLDELLSGTSLPIIGTSIDGVNLHQFDFPKSAYLLMGNESSGIKNELMKVCSHNVRIPKFGKAQSLNVAVATAIVCDNLLRKA